MKSTIDVNPENSREVTVNSLESEKPGAKDGVRLINSFLGGIDADLDDDDDKSDLNRGKSVEDAPRKNIYDRIQITASRRLGAQRFGIKLTDTSKNNINSSDLQALYESLNAYPDDIHLRPNAIFVKGVDKLSEFEVKRIFAEHRPETVQFVDETSCTVRWKTVEDVAQMFLDMSKPLRRVRAPRKAEEGELIESDEEEVGQVKEENGDDIAVVNDRNKSRDKKRCFTNTEDDFFEVNVEEVNVPTGKWRVITKHVPDNRLIIARFATGFDIRRGVINSRVRPHITFPDEEKHSNVDKDGFKYAWKSGKTRVRPGLNIFDEKGNELEWDYEHDTRFFQDSSDETNDESPRKKKKDVVPLETTTSNELDMTVGNVPIRSRGRGAKKFLAAFASDTSNHENELKSTLASDTVVAHKKSNPTGTNDNHRERGNDGSEAADNSEAEDMAEAADLRLDADEVDLDPTPTPQPWN